jgi:hypothetical protein
VDRRDKPGDDDYRPTKPSLSGVIRRLSQSVMPALGAGIHVLLSSRKKDVDGRAKPGHDECECSAVAPRQ